MKLNNKIYPIKKEEFQTGDILLFHWKPLCKTPYDCCMTCFSNVIQCFTKSKYTHSAMVVRDPPWRKDLKGLYILESSLETFPDAEDNEKKFGVQLTNFDEMINDFHGDVYWRKLICDRDNNFKEKLIKAHSIVHNRSYDINPIDYIKAGFDIEKGNNLQREKTFFCSSLVIFMYVSLGFLDSSLPWTILPAKILGSERSKKKLKFINCIVEKEVLIRKLKIK